MHPYDNDADPYDDDDADLYDDDDAERAGDYRSCGNLGLRWLLMTEREQDG